jgi:hypothetical protein
VASREVSATLTLTPLTIEDAVSATPSAAAGSAGRANSVAHFLAPHWGRIAERLAPVIDREGGDAGTAPRALICVPDSGAAVELATALRTARPHAPRILPVTDALRAARLLKASGAPIVIVTPADAERLMAASALSFDALQVVALVAADEIDADQLVTVMAAVPKEARRILIAADATPSVEALLERYFHKAVRLADDATSETTPAAVQFQLVRGANAAAHVPALLDELDPPSAVVVSTDAESVRQALAAHGYPENTDLVAVTDGAAPENVALVIFAGLPSATAFETAMSAQPSRAVALVAPRQLPMLKRLAGAAGVTPFVLRSATSAARAHEDRVRAELKAALASSYPAREIVALEPLLAEFDGVELAGAALRLLEAARTSAATAAAPVRSTGVAAAPPLARGPRERPAHPVRPRDDFPLKDPRPERTKPRFEDRTVRRDRDERPRRPFGDKPRDGDDRPRGGFGAKPRGSFGDKPRDGFGEKPRRSFGDKPRGSIGDKSRGTFSGDKARGGFGAKPRSTGPRRPRDDR